MSPQPDLVEIGEALELMSRPHYGSACRLIAELEGLPCATPRQEQIWMEWRDE